MVLFQRGAVRLLDRLLEDPQQQVEDLLAPDETIRSEKQKIYACWPIFPDCTMTIALVFSCRWSTCLVAESQQLVVFTSEQVRPLTSKTTGIMSSLLVQV